jgi:hypothetical protein
LSLGLGRVTGWRRPVAAGKRQPGVAPRSCPESRTRGHDVWQGPARRRRAAVRRPASMRGRECVAGLHASRRNPHRPSLHALPSALPNRHSADPSFVTAGDALKGKAVATSEAAPRRISREFSIARGPGASGGTRRGLRVRRRRGGASRAPGRPGALRRRSHPSRRGRPSHSRWVRKPWCPL